MPGAEKIKQLASRYFKEVQAIRHHLHSHPELSFKEFRTSDYIAAQLQAKGIAFTRGHAGTGIVATIQGQDPARDVVLLRADMDALPIQEKSTAAYASCVPGVMHACGHDVHSACMLGAAFILNETKNDWQGTVKIMFQPGEEVLPGGASLMIKEGVLHNPEVSKALALHVYPSMPAGRAGFRPGMYMASTDELYITVNGKGGHAAMPADYINPLLIASELLLKINDTFMKPGALKGTAGETIPTVVAFGKIEGRGATNVVPQTVELAGTMRTMNEDWRAEIKRRLADIVKNVSDQYGIESQLRIEHGYPFLVNNEPFTDSCSALAQQYLGRENVEDLPLRMTAEDFAFITQQVPSCFFRLGTAGPDNTFRSGVHTPTFDIHETALETGMGLMAWLAVNAVK